jgi:tetratricopeptide (TPR) repeat protein
MPNANIDGAKSLYLAGDYHRAEAACRALLHDLPDAADALNLLGLALSAQGRGAEAVAPLRRATAIDPQRASFPANLSAVLHKLGRNDEALTAANRAVALAPQVAGMHLNRSAILLALGNSEDALAAAIRAMALDPDLAVAHANHAAILSSLKRADEALEASRRALQLQPDLVEGHCNMAGALNALNRYAEACAAAQRALQLRPDDPDALNNQATALIGLARDQEAIQVLQHALRVKPEFPDAELNLGIACLAVGDYQAGWRHYERRLDTQRGSADRKLMDFPGPKWDGSDPAGQRLLLHREQGLGDTLMFARYAPALQAQGAKVTLRADRPLCTLLRESFQGATVSALDEPLGSFDAWIPLMSLPPLVAESVARPLRNVPYLRADSRRRAEWRQKLARGARLKVGLSWAGNPDQRNDRYRSMNLGDFAPLAAAPGIDFYSLQYGPRAGQALDGPPFDIVDFGAQIAPIEDMAALACELDLIILTDSMAAHLAGGLGVPCWLLLAHDSDWRWLRGRDDSPWYPTLRLFRQRALGDWSAPLRDMLLALRAATDGDRSRIARLCD